MTPTQRKAAEQALEAYSLRDYDMGKYMEALRAALAEQPAEQEPVRTEFNRVINHAIEQGFEASTFLRCWREGDWSSCKEFGFDPNTEAYTVPQPEAAPAVVQVPRWTLKKQHDIGIIFNECGERITACHLKEARAIVDAHNATAAPAKLAEQRSDERHLRRLLAVRVGMPNAYYDDGEAQGYELGIAIDFMREPVADIDAKLRALNVARAVMAEQPAEQKPVAVDWAQAGPLMDAAASAKLAGFLTGTTNWAAHVFNYMTKAAPEAPQPAKRVQLTGEEIDVLWAKQQIKPFKTHAEDRMAFARAIIAAYDAKNSITGED